MTVEGSGPWLDADEQRAWRVWLNAHAMLSARLNRELQAHSGLSLSDYDVLVALTDVEERALRMFELGERLQWEKSRLSKHLARMDARGLIRRTPCADDRRGANVELTPEGREAIEKAAPDHVALVRELVFDGLDAEHVRALREVGESLLRRLSDGDR